MVTLRVRQTELKPKKNNVFILSSFVSFLSFRDTHTVTGTFQTTTASSDNFSIGASTYIVECKCKLDVVKRLPVSSSVPPPLNQHGLQWFRWLVSSSISRHCVRHSFISIPTCHTISLTWLSTRKTTTDLFFLSVKCSCYQRSRIPVFAVLAQTGTKS